MPRLAFFATVIACLVVLAADRAAAAPGDISTFAGGGAGDGAPLNAAVTAYGLAVDGSGAVYIADAEGCRVRKLAGGVISTIVGTGVCGDAGDGGAATNAQLNFPQGVAVDGSGAIYIADTNNCRVRKVSGGTITAFAGAGLCTIGGDGGPATSGQLAFPRGVAVDGSANVYIADTDNCRVRKVASGTITTFAGNGACSFGGDGGSATAGSLSHPYGVAATAAGTVYIADTSNCRVRGVSGGVLSTIAGDGTCAFSGDGGMASAARVDSPRGVAVDASGNIYVADTDNCRLRQISLGTITTVAGSATCGFAGDGGPGNAGQLNLPQGAAVSGSTIYVADTANCRLRSLSGGTISTAAGTGGCHYGGDGGSATNAALWNPAGVARAQSGTVYIADTSNCRIRAVSGGAISTFAGTGICGYGGDGGAPGSAQFNQPQGVAVDAAGAVYVADTQNCRVRKIAGGVVTTIAGNGSCGYTGEGAATGVRLNSPAGVALDAVGAVYIADRFNCRVRKVTGATISTVAGNGTCAYAGNGVPGTSASLNFPSGVAVDSAGTLYIADSNNCRVRAVSAGGTITDFAGDGVCEYDGEGVPATSASLHTPGGVAVDAAHRVFVSTTGGCRVRRIVSGIIVTVAGNGICGFAGDGGPAINARLNAPAGLATGCGGELLITDQLTNRIRAVAAAGVDADCDTVVDTADNCSGLYNPFQENADGFIDLPPTKAYDDLTLVNSDTAGDACDLNDDNDGLPDTTEASPPCASASAPTDPRKLDTDGDLYHDGAECALGSDPANAASVPAAIVAPDADNDGVPDGPDPNDASSDSDGDLVPDGREFRYFNSNLANANTDGDGCGDRREIASINADQQVNSIDLSQVAQHFTSIFTDPLYIADFDIQRDRKINSIDLSQIAQAFGLCP